MSIRAINRLRPLTLVCGLGLVMAIAASAQVSTNQTTNRQNVSLRSVPSGSKMKFQGVVISRDADTFTIRDRSRADYQVLISDNTSIKTNGGFLRSGKKYPVTDILRGLIVEVEGRGNSQGQLVADKIRFNESDMRPRSLLTRASAQSRKTNSALPVRWMSSTPSPPRPDSRSPR